MQLGHFRPSTNLLLAVQRVGAKKSSCHLFTSSFHHLCSLYCRLILPSVSSVCLKFYLETISILNHGITIIDFVMDLSFRVKPCLVWPKILQCSSIPDFAEKTQPDTCAHRYACRHTCARVRHRLRLEAETPDGSIEGISWQDVACLDLIYEG